MTDIPELTRIYKGALAAEDLDVITSVIRRLNQEGRKFGNEALNLYEKINQDLFTRGIRIGILDLKTFRQRIDSDRRAAAGNVDKSDSDGFSVLASSELDDKSNDDVQEATPISIIGEPSEETSLPKPILEDQSPGERLKDPFVEFYNRHNEIFRLLKDFHCFYLVNSDDGKTPEILIVYDDDSRNNHLIRQLHESEAELKTNLVGLDDNLNEKYPEIKSSGSDYICLLCITPRLGDHGLKIKLGKFFQNFDTKYRVKIRTPEGLLHTNHLQIKPLENRHLVEIENHSNKVFSNRNLTFDQQTIIKKLFPGLSGIVDYNVINVGHSGSVVIELKFMTHRMRETRRAVIKIAEREDGQNGKLFVEKSNFETCVRWLPGDVKYVADYHKTESLEAIVYDYASTDTLVDSTSFSKLVDQLLKDKKNKINLEFLLKVLNTLFGCSIFVGWHQLEPVTRKCSVLYQRYLESENDVFEQIQKIKNKPIEECSLISNYSEIKKFELSTNEKKCHGDLHSENFLFDGTNVHLIDFGFTDEHHALVDHAFLEASIRFKHFPKYVPIIDLERYDANYFDIASFSDNFDLRFVDRTDLKELYPLISLIRNDAKKYMLRPDDPLEYLIALFMITFKLIKYSDLHQLYALEFATKLGAEIVRLIEPKVAEN